MARAAHYYRDQIQVFAEGKKENVTETPDFKELGSRGDDLEVSSTGVLTDTSDIALDTYRKMRFDPQVKACLLVLKLPILQVDWSLQAETEEGQQMAKWCESMLREYMDDSLQYYTREMLTALDFGRSITEKVWQLKNVPVDPDDPNSSKTEDRIIPIKLKTYDPRNIQIKMDPETLKLKGAVQVVNGQEVEIPASKLLIYSHEKEFNNYNGESALRAAYKPWVIKEFLQRFWNIALERYGTPFQSMSIPQGGSLETAMALMDLVKSKSGIPLPEGYDLEIHNMANAGMSFKDAIAYQDTMIARAMLIPDLVFANSGTGSYSLSKTHAGFFEMRLNGISQEVGDMYSKYLVRPMVAYNFGEVREYPAFTFSDVGQDDLTALSEVVSKMITGKVIAPTEGWIRERLGMPQPDDEAQEYLDKQKEVVMEGLENIKAANDGQVAVKKEEADKKTDPKKIGQDDKAKDKKDVKAEGKEEADKKKKEIAKNAEITDEEMADYYSENLRGAVRGLLKLGIGE
jgi:hypothetical protein